MAKYTATSETLGKELSEYIPFELDARWTRELFDASAAVSMGAVVSDGAEESPVYGIAIQDAAAGQEVTCVVRGAVINSAAVTLTDAQKAALKAQGNKII